MRSKAEFLGELSSMFGIQCESPTKELLATLSPGSIVVVIDPERELCYWAIIERGIGDHSFVATINPDCHFAGPTLRHGGTIAFHEDNIIYIWPKKVDASFDSLWFRILRHVISFGAGGKTLRRSTAN